MKNKFFAFYLVLVAVATNSCQKEPAQLSISEGKISMESKTIADKIMEMGLDTTGMKEFKDYYLVEGDVILSKSWFDGSEKGIVDERQWHTTNLCTTSTIFVKLANDLPQIWLDATREAMTKWNDVLGCSITFIEHASNYDIYVSGDNGAFDANKGAEASFPLPSGAPGPTITINTDFEPACGPLTPGLALRIMVHEFGHNIGFRHSNWTYHTLEIPGEEGAILIPGTPEIDFNSVMWTGGTCEPFTDFSEYDIVAVNYLYPTLNCISSGLYDDWLLFPNSGSHTNTVTVTWNVMKYNATHVRLELLYQDELYKWINYTPNYAPAYAPNGIFLSTITPNDGSHTVDLCYLAHEGGGFRFRISSMTNPCISDKSIKTLNLSSVVECM